MVEQDRVQLGGNIELVGFQAVDPSRMIVVKKIVGNYAKTLMETNSLFSGLCVTLENNDPYTISAIAESTDAAEKGACSHANIFFALDGALAAAVGKCQ